MSKQAISATLDERYVLFLDTLAAKRSVTRSKILDSILCDQYRQWLKAEMRESAQLQGTEDCALSEEGIEDYLKIIERDER